MCSLFGASKNTDTSQQQQQASNTAGTAAGTSTPVLDPSMAPLIPQIAAGAQGLLNQTPEQLVPDLNSTIQGGISQIQNVADDPALNAGVHQEYGDLLSSTATPSAVTSAEGALTAPNNIAYNSSGVPTVNAQQIGPVNVTGQQITADMSPYTSSVIDSQNALINKNNATQLAQLQAQQAGSKSFGDRSGLAQSDLMYNQDLAQQATLANLANTGYQTAQQQAEQDAARTLQTGQSNQSADLAAQTSNQGAGLTEAAGALQGQVSSTQLAQSGATAAGALAAQQQQIQQAGANSENAMLDNYENQRLTEQGAVIQGGALQQDVTQRQAAAPTTQLQNAANVVYGSPTGTSSTGTTSTNASGTASGTSTGSQTNNPSLFQDITGAAGIIASLKDGGLVRKRYADGGALDGPDAPPPGALDPAVAAWYAGRVHSSDVGPASDAPSALPPPPQDTSFHGRLNAFINRMADSPLAQFSAGVLAEPQSGLAPLSSGLQAVRAARMQDAELAAHKAQTASSQESLRESKSYFDYLQGLREGGDGSSPPLLNGKTPALSGIPGYNPNSIVPPGESAMPPAVNAAIAAQPKMVGPGSAASQAQPPQQAQTTLQGGAGPDVPLSLQWKLNQYNRIRFIPAMQAQATELYKSIQHEMPENMTLGKDGSFKMVPGYVQGQADVAQAKAAAEAPFKERQELLSRAGQAVKLGPNETVTTGAQVLGIPGIGSLASPGAATAPSAAITPPLSGAGGAPAVGRPTPAPGAAKEPPIVNSADTGLTKNADGSLSSFWNDTTKSRIDDFETARKTAIEEAEHAQESDVSIQRLKEAFAQMKAKGVNTGYYTPALGQVAAMAKSLDIDTSKIPVLGKMVDASSVGDIQTANKTSKVLMGKILKQMYPQRITNVDMAVNKGIAPGADIDESANLNLIDQISRQNAYDKNFADEIQNVDPQDVHAQLNFQRDFYKKYGYGPVAGTYFSQNKSGKIGAKPFSGQLPPGVPTGSVDTGRVTAKGEKIYQPPSGQPIAVAP